MTIPMVIEEIDSFVAVPINCEVGELVDAVVELVGISCIVGTTIVDSIIENYNITCVSGYAIQFRGHEY